MVAYSNYTRSLSTASVKKRFVFKTFARRVEEVDVDVFRSLTPIKFEPTSGSSFFQETLCQWRELNSAADFNTVYQQLMPLAGSLAQLLFHRNQVITILLSHVHLEARLSLSPILSLLAMLSRDLQEDFMPFVPNVIEKCTLLLTAGGDRDVEILEQVFTCLSYIFKHLSRHLVKDLVEILRSMKSLRYHSQQHVRDFAAEALSFLFRSSPVDQMAKGAKRLLAEVHADPCEKRINGCAALLFYSLQGPGHGFFSKTRPLLKLLLTPSMLSSSSKAGSASRESSAVEVLGAMLDLLCAHVHREKSAPLWDAFLGELHLRLPGGIPGYAGKEGSDESADTLVGDTTDKMEEWQSHVVRVMQLLNRVVEHRRGSRVQDYTPLFLLARLLLQPSIFSAPSAAVSPPPPMCFLGPVAPAKLARDPPTLLAGETLRLLNALMRSHVQVAGASEGPIAIARACTSWLPAFAHQDPLVMLPFLRSLVEQDIGIVRMFVGPILSALDALAASGDTEVLPVAMDLCYKLQPSAQQPPLLRSKEGRGKSALANFVEEAIVAAAAAREDSKGGLCEPELATLWAALKCLPYASRNPAVSKILLSQLAVRLAEQLSKLQLGETEDMLPPEDAVGSRESQESLLAATLDAHTSMLQLTGLNFVESKKQLSMYLKIAQSCRHAACVLNSVADFLDEFNGLLMQSGGGEDAAKPKSVVFPPELAVEAVPAALDIFAPNLKLSSKSLRLASLRVLTHYEPVPPPTMNGEKEINTEMGVSKRRKGLDGLPMETTESENFLVLHQLLAVEAAPLRLDSSRQSCTAIGRIRAQSCTGRVPEDYIISIVYHMLGVLNIKFALLWEAATDCLSGVVDSYTKTVWPVVSRHLAEQQNLFLEGKVRPGGSSDKDIEVSAHQDLWSRFEATWSLQEGSTSPGTLLVLLLKVLQKVPRIAEGHSRQLTPLFLTFVGVEGHGSDERDICADKMTMGSAHGSGKEWKAALKEWLRLIKEMKNVRAFYQGGSVKDVIFKRFLPDSDPAVQALALDCLLLWKDAYLSPYSEHLHNLIDYKTLREEITVWGLSTEKSHIEVSHRKNVIPYIVKILLPKIMKRSGKLAGKAAAGVNRSAVLFFLAQLDSHELASLFSLLLQPLSSAFQPLQSSGISQSVVSEGQGSKAPWEAALESGSEQDFLAMIDHAALSEVPLKRRLGFLHMAKDLLDVFGGNLILPYLHAITALTLRCLEGCRISPEQGNDEYMEASTGQEKLRHLAAKEESPPHGIGEEAANGEGVVGEEEQSAVDDVTDNGKSSDDVEGSGEESSEEGEKGGGGVEQGASSGGKGSAVTSWPREVRALSLRVLGTVFGKYPRLSYSSAFWPTFFYVLEIPIDRLPQEANCKSPGAVLQCFSSMSQDAELALLFLRNEALIPNILAILSNPAAAQAVTSLVLNVVENLLRHVEQEVSVAGAPEGSLGDGEVRRGGHAVHDMVVSYLPLILQRLEDLLTIHKEQPSGRKGPPSAKRELRLLVQLSKHIVEGNLAARLLEVLRPFLRIRKRMDQESCLEVLRVVSQLGPKLSPEAANTLVPVLAPLLVALSNRDAREEISAALLALSKADPSLHLAAHLLADLSAMSSDIIDEYDYTRRLDAYGRINGSLFSKLSRSQALLLLSHAVHDMGEEDMSLRHSAAHMLELFIQFAALLPEEEKPFPVTATPREAGIHDVKNQEEEAVDMDRELQVAEGNDEEDVVEDDMLPEGDLARPKALPSPGAGIRGLVQTFLLPHLKTALGSDNLTVRREWVMLLREIVLGFTSIDSLKEYRPLLSQDLEADFFQNIVHLQVHRRIRAMAQFRVICEEHPFSQGALMRIFVPLFQHSLFESKSDKDGNLAEAAVQTIASISRYLSWDPYFGLLMRMFRLIVDKAEHQKPLLRVMCNVLDQFHFFEDEPTVAIPAHEALRNVGSRSSTGWEGPINARGRIVPKKIQDVLTKRIFPELSKFMVSEMDVVNAPVALALVKVLLLLPSDLMDVELPRVLQRISNLLKSRGQGVRDVARATLVQISGALGAPYLHFAVDVLQSTLQRGFEVHVLGYTVHALLYNIIPTLKIGELDYCLDKLMEVLENDIMGEVGEEKGVEAIAGRMKETRHQRSYESLRLLAQKVDCKAGAQALLKPVKANLGRSLSSKVKAKLEEMLRLLGVGLQGNPSMTPELLLMFVYTLVEDGVQAEQEYADALEKKRKERIMGNAQQVAAEAAKQGQKRSKEGYHMAGAGDDEAVGDPREGRKGANGVVFFSSPKGAGQLNIHLLTEFALKMLSAFLSKGRIPLSTPAMLAMLDPLIGLLYACLDSKFDTCLALAMKTLAPLLKLPLPSVESYAADITARAFAIIHRAGRAANQMVQACLKMLTVIIQQNTTVQVTDYQLRALLQCGVFADLEDIATRNTAFSVLRAIVGRRLMVPELYDLMTHVSELMVRSQTPAMRQLCSQTLMQFLLDYPLGPRRLQQHLDFIIANLKYEHASGREAALEMLHAVITKFPDSVVEEQAQGMFLPLVIQLTGDSDGHVRAMVGAAIKSLMGRVGPQSRDKLFDFALTWYQGENVRFWRHAAQVSGIAIEVMGASFERRIPTWLPAVTAVLRKSVLAAQEGTESEAVGEASTVPLWHEAYFSLLAVEKLLQKMPDLALQNCLRDFWNVVCELLLHRHLWVRKVSTRLLGRHLSACPHPDSSLLQATALSGPGENESTLLHPARLLLLAATFVRVLDADVVDEKLVEQVVKNLVFVGAALPLLPLEEGGNRGHPELAGKQRSSQVHGGNLGASSQRVPKILGCSEGLPKEQVETAWRMLGLLRRNGRPILDDAESDEEEGDDELDAIAGDDMSETKDFGEEIAVANGNGHIVTKISGRKSGQLYTNVEATHENGVHGPEQKHSVALAALFRAMGKLALRVHPVQASGVLRWYAAMASQIGARGMLAYLSVVLLPLFRIVEGVAGQAVPEEIKSLGEEVMAHIRELVGVNPFVTAYNAAREHVRVRRDSRKTADKVSALVDPEARAQKKRKLSAKRQMQKRKKIMEFKRTRGSGDIHG